MCSNWRRDEWRSYRHHVRQGLSAAPLLAASHFHWDFCRLHRKEETHHQLCCHRATSFRNNSVLDYLSSTLQNFSSPPLTKGTTIATSILWGVWKSWKTKPSKDAWKKGLTRGTCSIPMWPQLLEQRLWGWWLQPWKASERWPKMMARQSISNHPQVVTVLQPWRTQDYPTCHRQGPLHHCECSVGMWERKSCLHTC